MIDDYWLCAENHPAIGTRFFEEFGGYYSWRPYEMWCGYVPISREGPFCRDHWDKRLEPPAKGR